MSVVFKCECGRRTTDPFIIDGVKMCVICAEEADPRSVDNREKRNYRRYTSEKMNVSRSRYGRHFD